MNELFDLHYKIDDLLGYLNKLSTYPQPSGYYVRIASEFTGNEFNFNFSITLKKHIDRLCISLNLIKDLSNEDFISYISYSNFEYIFLSIKRLENIISGDINSLKNALEEINKFNDKLIKAITFKEKYAVINSSVDSLNGFKFEYSIGDIFLENERTIDALVRCFTDLSVIRDRKNNSKTLSKIDSTINSLDISFIEKITTKKSEIGKLASYLLENKSFIENINSHKNEFESIISGYEETEKKLLNNANNLNASINKTNTALSEFKSKSDFIDEKYKIIKNDESNINAALESISEINKTGIESRKINNFMLQNKNEIETILADAKNTLNLVSGASIAEYITQQEDKENKAASFWLKITGATLVISLLLIILSFAFLGFSWDAFILKSLTLPILLSSIIFSMRQYIKRKNIVDSYAHKKTLALSLTGFRKQINSSADDEKQINYILKAIEIMTESPLNDLDKSHIKSELEALEKIRESIIENVISTINPEKVNRKEN